MRCSWNVASRWHGGTGCPGHGPDPFSILLPVHPIPEASPELSRGSSPHPLRCAQETTLLLESSSHPCGLEVTFWGKSEENLCSHFAARTKTGPTVPGLVPHSQSQAPHGAMPSARSILPPMVLGNLFSRELFSLGKTHFNLRCKFSTTVSRRVFWGFLLETILTSQNISLIWFPKNLRLFQLLDKNPDKCNQSQSFPAEMFSFDQEKKKEKRTNIHSKRHLAPASRCRSSPGWRRQRLDKGIPLGISHPRGPCLSGTHHAAAPCPCPKVTEHRLGAE